MDAKRPALLTFDCYGTLIDWDSGVGAFLYELFLRRGIGDPPPGSTLQTQWEELQFDLIRSGYQPYRQILSQSLEALLETHALRIEPGDGDRFARAMCSWQPFCDTKVVLSRLREHGLRLAIISNTDRDLIHHSLRQIEVCIDAVVTAEDCRAYKPSEEVFEQALASIGAVPEDVVHVAFGYRYDITPAHKLGIPTAWINRYCEPEPGDKPNPTYQWRDLWGLLSLVEQHLPPSPAAGRPR
jgi:2-haloalkanoic acid dehalogenase type II